MLNFFLYILFIIFWSFCRIDQLDAQLPASVGQDIPDSKTAPHEWRRQEPELDQQQQKQSGGEGGQAEQEKELPSTRLPFKGSNI